MTQLAATLNGGAAVVLNAASYVPSRILVTNTPGTWPAGSFIPNETILPLGDVAGNVSTIVIQQLIDVISGVTTGCYTLSKTSQDVQREMSDQPLYLQTSDTSIQDYKQRYGKDPLMPLSLAMSYLKDLPNTSATGSNPTDPAYDSGLSPIQGIGSPQFQMLYGVRGLLSSIQTTNATISTMPGVRSIFDAYNAGTTSRDRIDESDYKEFVSRITTSLRYMVDTRGFRAPLLQSGGTYGAAKLFEGVNPVLKVFPLRTTSVVQILEIPDSSYQEDKIQEMVKDLLGTKQSPGMGSSNNRNVERIQNIIDLNIMPINIHGIMRSMALANVYNYAYTYEEMGCSFFKENRKAVSLLNTAGVAPTGNTKSFFLSMLLDPYRVVSEAFYGDEIADGGTAAPAQRMFRGDNDLTLGGRPKFMSDQMFNKVMFGSLYPMQADFDESGPGGQVLRGRQGWNLPGTAGFVYTGNAAVNVLDAMIKDAVVETTALSAGPAVNLADIQTRIDAVTIPATFTDYYAAGVNPGAAKTNSETAIKEYQKEATALAKLVNGAALANPMTTEAIRAAYVGAPVAVTPSALENYRTTAAGPILGLREADGKVDYRTILVSIGLTNDEIAAIVAAVGGGNIDVVAQKGLAPSIGKYLARLVNAAGTALRDLASAIIAANPDKNFTGPVYPLTDINAPTGTAPAGPGAGVTQQLGTTVTYIGKDAPDTGKPPWSVLKTVGFGTMKPQMLKVGKNRFDSALMRNLLFITNTYRLVRAKLAQELAESRTIIQRGNAMVATSLTEFGTDPSIGVNETASSRTYMTQSMH
jgi:hypothetical protein